MKKIRLDFDELAVQSFATGPASRRNEGTVHGRGQANLLPDPGAYAEAEPSDVYPGCITEIKTDNRSECFPADCR